VYRETEGDVFLAEVIFTGLHKGDRDEMPLLRIVIIVIVKFAISAFYSTPFASAKALINSLNYWPLFHLSRTSL
jgi:hypothetical protein